ncbi:hypothetical protein [Lacinutrix sp. MEBiC02404]
MRLNNIDIQLRLNPGDTSYQYLLKKRTRHILNYIERNCLKPLKFDSTEYRNIVITLKHGFEEKYMNLEPYISSNKSLVIELDFKKERYDNLSTNNEFREFFHQILITAFKKAETKYVIPSTEILESYEELKENKFINNWIFKKKSNKNINLLVELNCNLTISKFELSLIIIRDKKEIYNKIILETDPDELAFEYRFKDIIIEDDKVIIIDKRKKILKEVLLSEI